MKVTISETNETKQRNYPYYGIAKNRVETTVVLFDRENEGTCIHTTLLKTKVGDYFEHWIESDFVPFIGSINISND